MDRRTSKTLNTSYPQNWGLKYLREIVLLQDAKENRKNSTFRMKTKLIFIFLTMLVFFTQLLNCTNLELFQISDIYSACRYRH